MHALRLASETPSALLDWNNNYGDDPDKAVCFHCSNLPKHFFTEVRMDYQEIIAGTVGKLNTFGTCVGRVKSGPMSFARFSTDDRMGVMRGYVGEGEFTDDPLITFGGAGVVKFRRLQELLRHICEHGFEHHMAANLRQLPEPCTRRRPVSRLGDGLALKRCAVVAGVDFGTLSVRVSIIDSEKGDWVRGTARYPLHRKKEDPDYATQSHADHMRALGSAAHARA